MNVERNGSIKNVRVTQTSGITSFDRTAVAAIDASKAFPALPSDFSGTQLTIELEFTHVVVGFDPKPVARPAVPR
jgi:TonB family protein